MAESERKGNGEMADGPAAESQTHASDSREEPATEAREETMESLRADVERLTREAERNWQHFLRTAADLENYRKQAARQREDAVAATRRSMLSVILNVVDTLERALAHADAVASSADDSGAVAIANGIRLAHRQVLDTLKAMDVRPMETVGAPFDPRMHEAVEAVPVTSTGSAGTVVGEVQRGYFLGDEVLRPARVRVAQ